ncbi:MAG: hypothetical protein GAK39_06218 [Variovorax sp.]|nr:MAG: hypothetical protein GAK39_06218 [Variovorax sp.]
MVVGVDARAVVAAAERGDPALVPLDLVLQVDAGLGQPHPRVGVRRGHRERLAVDRREDLELRRLAEIHHLVEHAALVVQAQQHGVLPVARAKLGLHLVVEREGLATLGAAGEQRAVDGVEVRRIEDVVGIVGDEAVGVDLAVVGLDAAVARVLPHGPGVVEAVLEQVAEVPLVLVVAVEAGLADEGRARNAAVGRAQQRAGHGQEAVGIAGADARVMGQHRQRGVARGPPGQRGREELAPVAHAVDLGLAVLRHRREAVEPLALRIERPREVGRHALERTVAGLHLHFAQRLLGRPLADDIDHAARAGLAVEHRRGTAQHLDALGAVALHAPDRVARVVAHLHAVEVEARRVGVEAAQREPVVAAVVAVEGLHAGRVGQRVGQARGTHGRDAIGRDDRDRLRRLDQRRVGLGAGGAAPGHIAFDMAARGLGLRAGGHGHRRQAAAAGVRRRGAPLQDEAAVGLARRLQAAARQQAVEPALHRVAAAQAVAAQPGGQLGRKGQQDAGLAAEAVERVLQRVGGNVVAVGRRRGLGADRQGRDGAESERGGERHRAEGEPQRRPLLCLTHGNSTFRGHGRWLFTFHVPRESETDQVAATFFSPARFFNAVARAPSCSGAPAPPRWRAGPRSA